MDWINYTLFTFAGDRPVLLIDLVTSVLGLTCVFLAGRNNKYNFWVGYLYTVALFLMFWNKNLYASLLLQPISLGINILGQYRCPVLLQCRGFSPWWRCSSLQALGDGCLICFSLLTLILIWIPV